MSETLAHAVGDYVVQTHWMATEKLNRCDAAAVHALTYTLCFVPLTRNVKALAVIGGTHFVIDRWRLARHLTWVKNQLGPKSHRFPMTATGYHPDTPDATAAWLLVATDNVVHLLINRWALRRFR